MVTGQFQRGQEPADQRRLVDATVDQIDQRQSLGGCQPRVNPLHVDVNRRVVVDHFGLRRPARFAHDSPKCAD